jgi:hypothetical protein
MNTLVITYGLMMISMHLLCVLMSFHGLLRTWNFFLLSRLSYNTLYDIILLQGGKINSSETTFDIS